MFCDFLYFLFEVIVDSIQKEKYYTWCYLLNV